MGQQQGIATKSSGQEDKMKPGALIFGISKYDRNYLNKSSLIISSLDKRDKLNNIPFFKQSLAEEIPKGKIYTDWNVDSLKTRNGFYISSKNLNKHSPETGKIWMPSKELETSVLGIYLGKWFFLKYENFLGWRKNYFKYIRFINVLLKDKKGWIPVYHYIKS